jgi:hypothetical protein
LKRESKPQILTGTLSLNVVSVAQPAELLLAGRVPHVEPDGAPVRVEHQRVHLIKTKFSTAKLKAMMAAISQNFEKHQI